MPKTIVKNSNLLDLIVSPYGADEIRNF